MRRLQLIDHTGVAHKAYPRSALAKCLGTCLAVVFGFGAFAQISNAQSPNAEADKPPTAEDIAKSVKAVNAVKQDKAKVKIYCGVFDILGDDEKDSDAASKKTENTSTDAKAEEAMDAKVSKIIDSLGDDFSDAYNMLAYLAEDSPVGKPLISAFEELDKSCDSQGQ